MAQHERGVIGIGTGWVGRRAGQEAARAVTLCALLLGPRLALAGEAAESPPRSAAELIPPSSRFFLEVDLGALRDRGPGEAVRRIVTMVTPLASEAGLSAERLRTVVMASAEETLASDKLPSWLLFAQDGAAPSLSKLETTFRPYSRAVLKPGSVHGIAYRGSHDLSVLQLPGGGPTLIAGSAGPQAIVQAWQGKGDSPLVRSTRAELLHRVTGDRPGAFRLWLTLTSAMQRSLVDDAHLPAVPSELAVALRLLPDRGAELGLLARCSDEETTKRLVGWLGTRLATLATSAEVQLLGLSSYLQAIKVTSDATVVRLQLAMSADEVAALLERAGGLLGSLAPRGQPGAEPQPRPGPDKPTPRPRRQGASAARP